MKFARTWLAPHWQVAALALAVAGVVGCDPIAQSNKDVLAKIASGDAKLSKASGYKPTDAVTSAHTDLAAAANDKNADPGYQAIAAAAVAGVDQGVAQTSAATFYDSVLHARQTLVELRMLASQIAYSAALADGNKKADPKEALAKLTASIQDLQGSADKATWGPDAAKLPTLAFVKQETSRLQGEIATQQQKIADLGKQRIDLIATSEAQLKHADGLKGDDGVRAFADGSESRRKADDLAIQIDVEKDKLARAQADLSLQQGQEAALNAGIALLQGHSEQLGKNWADSQQRAENQAKIITAAMEGDDQNKLTLKQLSSDLAKQLADVSAQRTAADDNFKEADKYYGLAQKAAQALGQSFAEKLTTPGPNATNYKKLKEALQPQQYQLQVGLVRRDAAALIAAEAGLLADASATKTLVAAVLTPAGLQTPAELAAVDVNAAKTLADDADLRLGESAEQLTNVESGDTTTPIKNAAKIGRLIALNARIQLAGLKGTLGDTSAAATVSQMMSDAKDLKEQIVTAGQSLPRLPGELGQTPPPPTPDAPLAPAAPATPAATPAPAAG